MTKKQIAKIVAKQRVYYAAGVTLDVSFRMDALKKLCHPPGDL